MQGGLGLRYSPFEASDLPILGCKLDLVLLSNGRDMSVKVTHPFR